jgi:hypothetical protein
MEHDTTSAAQCASLIAPYGLPNGLQSHHFPPGFTDDALSPHREPSLAMSSGNVHLPSRIKPSQPEIKNEIANT